MEIKKEKGSITLFVLISCLFMIIILLVVNIGVMNKNRSQEKNLEEIAKQYSQNETDLDNAYAKVADENKYLTEKEIKELIEESKLEMYPVGSIYIYRQTNKTQVNILVESGKAMEKEDQ